MMRRAIGAGLPTLALLPLLLIAPFSSADSIDACGVESTTTDAGIEIIRLGGICPTTLQPVLIHVVAGGTLTGVIQTQLTVYSSGLVIEADASRPVFFGELDPNGSTQFVRVSADTAAQLQADLRAAGAWTLRGRDTAPCLDAPVTTITVFSRIREVPRRRANRSRTFSRQCESSPAFARVESVVSEFRREHLR